MLTAKRIAFPGECNVPGSNIFSVDSNVPLGGPWVVTNGVISALTTIIVIVILLVSPSINTHGSPSSCKAESLHPEFPTAGAHRTVFEMHRRRPKTRAGFVALRLCVEITHGYAGSQFLKSSWSSPLKFDS